MNLQLAKITGDLGSIKYHRTDSTNNYLPVAIHATVFLTFFLIMLAMSTSVMAGETWSGYEVKPLDLTGEGLGDGDKDGVIDQRDNCENVNADAAINNAGCAQEKDILAQMILNITFDSDDWHVKPEHYPELKRFKDFYQKHPSGFITIEGHTDSTGNAEHNMKLSQLRAQAVVKLLTDNYGFDKHKISWVGYGESKPVSDNETREGRKKNRRIVAVIRAHERHEVRNWSVY